MMLKVFLLLCTAAVLVNLVSSGEIRREKRRAKPFDWSSYFQKAKATTIKPTTIEPTTTPPPVPGVMPESFKKILMSIRSKDDFERRFGITNGMMQKVGLKKDSLSQSNLGGRKFSDIVLPKWCSTHPSLVKIEQKDVHYQMYYPDHFQTIRCVGTVSAPGYHECVPRTIVYGNISVLAIPTTGSSSGYLPLVDFPTEFHLDCYEGCRVKAKDCNEFQDYDANSCSCKCKPDRTYANFGRSCSKSASDGMGYSHSECKCECKLAGKICTTANKVWSKKHCDCVCGDIKCGDARHVVDPTTCQCGCPKKSCSNVEMWNDSLCKCVSIFSGK